MAYWQTHGRGCAVNGSQLQILVSRCTTTTAFSLTLGKVAATLPLGPYCYRTSENHAGVGVATDAPNKFFNKSNGLLIDD